MPPPNAPRIRRCGVDIPVGTLPCFPASVLPCLAASLPIASSVQPPKSPPLIPLRQTILEILAVHERMPSAPQLESTPASRKSVTPRSVIHQRIGKLIFSTALIASAATFVTPRATAQDLGEIARQERAKKQNNPAPGTTHIYTNDDVKRQQILTPEDQARFSATTQPATAKPSQSATQLASESTPGNADLPIGARPPLLVASAAPEKTSPPTRTAIRRSAHQQTKQPPAQPNISSASTMRAKTNSMPVARATNSVAAKRSQPIATRVTTPAPIGASQSTATTAHATAPVSPSQPVATAALVQTAQLTVPLDQMPLGDVARYYRAKKQQNAEASAKAAATSTASASTVALIATSASAPASPTTQPIAIAAAPPLSLDRMPLGDVARYYRAKKREEDTAIATAAASTPQNNPVPSISAPIIASAPIQSANSHPATAPTSSYPLPIAAMPLATMKPPPTQPLGSPPSASAIHRRDLNLSSSNPVVSPPDRIARPRNPFARPRDASPSRVSAFRDAAPVASPRPSATPTHRPSSRTSPIVPISRPNNTSRHAISIRIVRGDTLWQLARKYLGSGARWQEFVALNPSVQDPRRLQIGAQLVLHPSTT
jgi:LysM domain